MRDSREGGAKECFTASEREIKLREWATRLQTGEKQVANYKRE